MHEPPVAAGCRGWWRAPGRGVSHTPVEYFPTMPNFSPYVLAGLRAARAAGEIQRRLFGHLTSIDYKARNDPVTEADRRSEETIIEILHETFPDHAFLAEEGGRRGESAFTWVIDPLDGTTNYIHGIPWFAVSIALVHEARSVAGIVLDTIRGEVYAADAGGGAYAATFGSDGKDWGDPSPWHRASVSETRRLDRAVLSTGFPQSVAETHLNVDHFGNLLMAAAKTRNLGSAALALAAVALGRTDGYWEIGPKAWDFAGGAILVEEAGGRVSDLRGRPLRSYGGQILATNGLIHDQMVAVLAKGHSSLDDQPVPEGR
jgi:myo-inositol-1(or 4)-monophosphatase